MNGLRLYAVSCAVPLGSMNGSGSSPELIKEEIEGVVGERWDGFSKADLAALVREAGVVVKTYIGSSGSGRHGRWC